MAASKTDLAPEVLDALGEGSQCHLLYDRNLPVSADVCGVGRFVKDFLGFADMKDYGDQVVSLKTRVDAWLERAVQRDEDSRPSDLGELADLLSKLKAAVDEDDKTKMIIPP